MEVNEGKTKVMVFRKGGHLGKHENWYYAGKSMNVVNSYTYLGFTFTTKLQRRNFRFCSKRQEGSFFTYVKP